MQISLMTYNKIFTQVVAYQKLHHINRNKCNSTMKYPRDLAKFQDFQ